MKENELTNNDSKEPGRRHVVLTMGVVNTVLFSMTFAPSVQARTRHKRVREPAVKKTAHFETQQVFVRQRGNVLYVTVYGTPGMYVGAFYSRAAKSRDDFKPVPGKCARIGKDRRAHLRINVSLIKSKRFFIGLAVARDKKFNRLVAETEVVEVRIAPNTMPMIAGFEKMEAVSKPSLVKMRPVAAKGGKGGGGLGGSLHGLAKKGFALTGNESRTRAGAASGIGAAGDGATASGILRRNVKR